MRVSTVEEMAGKAADCDCSVKARLDAIGGMWEVVILNHITRDGTRRPAFRLRKIPGNSERMLTQQVRKLEEDGIEHREACRGVPASVGHLLTGCGRSLRPITGVTGEWGSRHIRRSRAG